MVDSKDSRAKMPGLSSQNLSYYITSSKDFFVPWFSQQLNGNDKSIHF